MARIAVAMPGFNFSYVWVAHMLQLQAQLLGDGHTVAIAPCYTNNIYITRQQILNSLLKDKELDYILWVDDDNIVNTAAFARMLDDLECHTEADAVCGWYFLAGEIFEGVRSSCGTFSEKMELIHFTAEQLQSKQLLRAEWAGLGCVLMRKRALELVGDRPFRPILGDWELGYTGDDISFFHRFHSNGGVMYCDPQVHVPHLKLRCVAPPAQVPEKQKKEEDAAVAA